MKKFFEGINLGNFRVTIIGLGGGGEIALHLLRSGIQNLFLIDFDILEKENLCRHICGSRFVGKNKAQAVKELLEEYQGEKTTKIKSYTWDIFDETKKLQKIVRLSDVVVVATDTDSSRYFINEICVQNKTPAVFVSMFEEGSGGEIFTYKPKMACLECGDQFAQRTDFLEKYEKSTNKKDCSSARDTSGMPGLGIDQSFLCSIAARKVLDIIIEKSKKSSLPPVGKNWIIWSLYGIKGVVDDHLSSFQMNFPKHKNCRLCN